MTADLLGDRANGGPLRPVLRRLVQDHPDGALTDLRGKGGVSGHGSNLSRSGVSGKSGPIQTSYWIGYAPQGVR